VKARSKAGLEAVVSLYGARPRTGVKERKGDKTGARCSELRV
jgi:hypothetical protein